MMNSLPYLLMPGTAYLLLPSTAASCRDSGCGASIAPPENLGAAGKQTSANLDRSTMVEPAQQQSTQEVKTVTR